MDKTTLNAIHDIRSSLNELYILTKGKDAEYFYERLEMNILLELIEKIEKNLEKINGTMRNKYNYIPWNIIKDKRYDGSSMKLRDVWELASSLYDVLDNKLNGILEKELENYYHMVCVKRQEEIRKEKQKIF